MNAKALSAILVPAVAIGVFCAWPSSRPAAVASPSLPKAAIIALAAASALSSHEGSAPVAEVIPTEAVDLPTALEQGSIKADFKGNGRETLAADFTNQTKSRLQVKVEVGQVFESGRAAVVVVRPSAIEIAPGQTAQATFQTAATRSSNKVEDAAYVLTYNHVPRIEVFLTYVQDHLELSSAAIQTAILALTENLPLSSVAKFTSSSTEVSSRFNTDAFRVETFDILSALAALKAMRLPDSSVAMTVDPQLRIEAMIEPLCRPTAMRYYSITTENEWAFWKTELLSGDPTTRHYALYGIARFYPDIAVEMLPKWARETKTNAVLRLAAVQALTDTHRPEVITILKQLADDLGRETELGRAARGAALALDQRLGQMASAKTATVNFRASQTLSEF